MQNEGWNLPDIQNDQHINECGTLNWTKDYSDFIVLSSHVYVGALNYGALFLIVNITMPDGFL